MTLSLNRILQNIAAAMGLMLMNQTLATAQTLPIAGDPPQAVAQDRADRNTIERDNEAVRGVREQDQAALRTANRLNRDVRQEARQELTQAVGQGATANRESNFRPGIDGSFHDGNVMNSGLRGADLGLWFNSKPGVNGLVVADVAAQGPFAQAGIREGDRIVSINGLPVTTEAQFVQALSTPGASAANMVINRNGQSASVAIQPSAVMQNIAAADPLFQYGVLLNESNPAQMVVQRVFPRTPAFYAGLRPGDVITDINGQPITSLSGLTQALQAGGNLALQVTRNGQVRDLTLAAMDNSIRTAMAPNRNTTTTLTNTQAGAVTGTQLDQSGLNTTGTVTPTTSTAANTAVPGTPTGTTPTTGATLSGATSATQSATAAANGVGVPSVTRGIPTAVPGISPSTLPGSGNVLAPPVTNFGPVNAGAGPLPFGSTVTSPPSNIGPASTAIPGGTRVGSLGTSGISPANAAVPAFGSASATGATGTTGGAGSTAGGIGAVGGTGASGGTGSTAGPSGGAVGGRAGVGAAGGATGGAAAGGT